MNAKQNAHEIRLASEQGDLNTSAAKTIMHKSEDNNLLQSDNDHIVEVANAARVKTQKQDIHIQSGQDLKLTANNDINFVAENKDLSIKSGQHTIISTKDMAAINSEKQDINIHNVNGSTYFKVNKGVNINTVKPGNVTIAQSGAKIQINSDGSIAIQAKKIAIKGKQNNLQSNQANLGGTGHAADLSNIAQIALGIIEEIGGVPEDEIGIGEALQADGTRRLEKSVVAILKPGGKFIGKTGTTSRIRQLSGGEKAAKKLFDHLGKKGRTINSSTYSGKLVELPDGTKIGYRPVSKSGPPTIDVKIPGEKNIKLKFIE